MPRQILALLLVLVTASCSDNNRIPRDILPQAKMRDVMWDLIRADEFVYSYIWKNDSLVNRLEESVSLYGKIFRIHHITKDQFRKSLAYYRQHPGHLRIIVDSLNRKGNSQRNKSPALLSEDTQWLPKNDMPVE